MKLQCTSFILIALFSIGICQTANSRSIKNAAKESEMVSAYSNNGETEMLTGPRLKIKMYLEGAMINATGVAPDGKPLMRDNLRVSPFTGKNYIPLSDPYKTTINFVDLSDNFKHVGAGALPEYGTITDSAAVFGVSNHNAIVDWVFVEVRSQNDNKQVIATRSGLLQRDGDVVDVDGVSDLLFSDLTENNFYVVVKHRNHLGTMSSLVSKTDLIDFTSTQFPVFDFGTTMGGMLNYTGLARKNQDGFAYLWAGNLNGDNVIKFDPPGDDHNILILETSAFTTPGGFNTGANGYFQGDIDMNSKVKYDNPNDDKNYLLAQIVSYEINDKLLINYTYFIEQVPTRNP